MLLTASVTSVIAQRSTLLATLNHNDTISVFYGANALVEAHNAAVDGDVINLSSGNFTATKLTKSITLRGMGMEIDTVNNIYPTFVVGDLGFQGVISVCIEGIQNNERLLFGEAYDYGRTTILDLNFSKCRFREIVCPNKAQPTVNATFTNCKITYDFTLDPTHKLNCIFIKGTSIN